MLTQVLSGLEQLSSQTDINVDNGHEQHSKGKLYSKVTLAWCVNSKTLL